MLQKKFEILISQLPTDKAIELTKLFDKANTYDKLVLISTIEEYLNINKVKITFDVLNIELETTKQGIQILKH
jgi:hypothetical protein